jgi:EPS-associated MarR family transcriptional regulator
MPRNTPDVRDEAYLRILRLLEEHPEASQRDLAERLGMSLGGVNYCLKALMERGLVKLENFQNSRHKFKYVYVLTPAGLAQRVSLTGRFLRRKMAEYKALEAEIEQLKAEVQLAERADAGRQVVRS